MVASREDSTPTTSEWPRAARIRWSPSTGAYQRRDGPLNGGTGTAEP